MFYPKRLIERGAEAGEGITGSGTLNQIPKFTPDGDTLGDSQISDDGTIVAISNASVDPVLRCQNTTNSAGKDAFIDARVAGTSAGDPIFRAFIDGSSTWAWGLDNDVGDAFKIASALTLGTAGDRLVLSTGGLLGIGAAVPTVELHVTQALTANPAIRMENLTNSASENAFIDTKVAGTSAGDPTFRCLIAGGQSWAFGCDNTDADSFKISASNLLGTSDLLTLETGGNLGLGITSPDGKLHIHTASAGAVTANADADDVVIENNSTTGLSILFPDTTFGQVYFGTPTDNVSAAVRYTATSLIMDVGTAIASGQLNFKSGNFIDAMRIDASGNIGCGIATPDGSFHIHTASAGSVAASATADELVLENSGDGGLSILVPDANNANIYLGTPTKNSGGIWRWDHSITQMTLGTNIASGVLKLSTGAFVTAVSIDGSQNVTIAAGNLILEDGLDFVLKTTSGSRVASAATQKLGFWGATPIVQPSGTGETVGFTAGVGTGVNDDSTFTGNVGATAYNLNDIVKGLKNSGLLAQ